MGDCNRGSLKMKKIVLVLVLSLMIIGVTALDQTLSNAEDNKQQVIDEYNNWDKPLLEEYNKINIEVISNKIVVRRYNLILEEGKIVSINPGNVDADFTITVPMYLLKDWLIEPKQDWEQDYDKLKFDPVNIKYELKQKCQYILNIKEIE